MKTVMMPIKAIHARRIFRGEKTLEIRKSRPMAVGEYRVLLYISKEKGKEKDLHPFALKYGGKIAGEFIVRNSYPMRKDEYGEYPEADVLHACMTQDTVHAYARGRQLYGLCVEEPKLYREPRELESYGIQRPPQNWRWVENDAEIH